MLDAYVADCRKQLESAPLDVALKAMAADLARLLKEPTFVAVAFSEADPPGKRVLAHDATRDFYVLAHVQEGGKAGKPHSHGASWAIYGTARGATGMTEWRRVNDAAAEAFELKAADEYVLGPGDTRAYGPNVIHSTNHPAKAWVIRVTGGDLDQIPRYHFKASRDRVVA
jgi:predicted metal-dependent enzyme (double-stranded beta helix superfamily)